MAKRIILISSFPLLVAIAIIAIVLAGIGHGQTESIPADANAAVDKLIADIPVSREKGTTLQQAQDYFENSDYQQAEQIYQV
jgi:L-asparaginase/Glu-tRNA(Gln) amidotransferase subunit D